MVESLDARGRRCSLLIMMISERIDRVAAGNELEVVTDDPGATSEVPSWCRRVGHELLAFEAAGPGEHRIRIRKNG